MSALLQRGPHVSPLLRVLIGACLAVAGAAVVLFCLIVANGLAPSLEGVAFALGLGGLPLLSGVAQVVMLMGAALVWANLRRR